MPSLIQGFEYDIFISYRHNRSGWVTEFVEALQEELASTIKEPLSIYFDKNPHDGLLETHHVNKSLEGKLKCLIFLPILSQTYCDPKSFAWRHEFCTFNKLSQEDELGREIRLKMGNVASRILPVKIHELDAEDITCIETETGSVLRAIEFIYKEPGVNRPLLPHEEHPHDNKNKTFYRDQINKTALAIKDLITVMTNPASAFKGEIKQILPQRNSLKKFVIPVILTALILLILLFYFKAFKTVQHEDEKSIAVLPFVNMSSDPDQEYFSDGIMEEIINHLVKVKQLKVTSRTTAMSYRNSNLSIRNIAKELGVAYILEGSVRKSDNMIRITLQLIETNSDSHLWSETYDRELKDIFAVQTEIAKRVSQSLLISLSPDEYDAIQKQFTTNEQAYELYLKGRYYWNLRRVETMGTAIELYNQAIALDPNYAMAYAAIGDAYLILGVYQLMAPKEAFSKVVQYCGKALQIDSTISEAYATFIDANIHYYWNLSNAEQFYEKAVKLNPNNGNIYHWYSEALFLKGHTEEGIHYERKALEIEPNSLPFNLNLGLHFMFDHKFEIAIDHLRHTIQIDSSFATAHLFLGQIFCYQKDFDSALIHMRKAAQLSPGNSVMLSNLAFVESKSGHQERAKEIHNSLLKASTDRFISSGDLALVSLGLGDREGALEYLEKAFEERYVWMVFIPHFLLFYELHGDSQFEELMLRTKNEGQLINPTNAFLR